MSTYEISKSSLLSLKAEILRKQEELNKSKLQNKAKKLQPKKLEVKNKGVEEREVNDYVEDEDLLLKSRKALESKAKLYDKLSKRSNFTEDEIERNRRFLVNFDGKKSKHNDLPPEESDNEMDTDKYPESEEEQFNTEEYDPPTNPDEEWVEYTDCLGRTRKCMKKDLDFLISKDADLRASVDKDENKQEQLIKPEDQKVVELNPTIEDLEDFDENNELLSSDMRRELLRKQWEKEEEELRDKDDIHYQDILFNEARTHGVGYYGFSKDEDERFKQQQALKNLRKETQEQQKKAQGLKTAREKQLAGRMKAARNRKRARMGLPPEEEEPEVEKPAPEEKQDEEEEKEKLEIQQKEKEKEAERKKHIRPWDIGKEGVREHYEYSQEEWVEKQRKERKKEFAPPSAYQRSFKSDTKIDIDVTESDKRLYFSTKRDKTEKRRHETESDREPPTTSKSLLKRKPQKFVNPYKSATSTTNKEKTNIFEPAPIINECEDFDEEQDRLLRDYKTLQTHSSTAEDSDEADYNRGKGAEIAPPTTFDYYGPTSTKKNRTNNPKPNIEESITAGLKFLRQQVEKKGNSKTDSSDLFLF